MSAFTLLDAPVGFYSNDSLLSLKLTTSLGKYEGMLSGADCVYYSTDPVSGKEVYSVCQVGYIKFDEVDSTNTAYMRGRVRFTAQMGDSYYLMELMDVVVGLATDVNDQTVFVAMPPHFYEDQKDRISRLMKPGIKGRRVGHLTVVG